MKKYLMLAALIAITTTAFANENATGEKTRWRDRLTAEQKACLESHGCPKFTKEEKENMSDAEWAEKRGCKRAAFEACGIERPARQNGERMKNKNKS